MEKRIPHHLISAIIAIVLYAVVLYVSLLPKTELPEVHLFQVDKIVHFSMYFVLSIVTYWGFFKQKNFKNVLFACALAFLYGCIVEVLQFFVAEGRMFDNFDILANGLGTIFAYFVVNKYL